MCVVRDTLVCNQYEGKVVAQSISCAQSSVCTHVVAHVGSRANVCVHARIGGPVFVWSVHGQCVRVRAWLRVRWSGLVFYRVGRGDKNGGEICRAAAKFTDFNIKVSANAPGARHGGETSRSGGQFR